MSPTPFLSCHGLSTALTALRIKQFLLTLTESQALPLTVAISDACDRAQLVNSLGAHAKVVHFQ